MKDFLDTNVLVAACVAKVSDFKPSCHTG